MGRLNVLILAVMAATGSFAFSEDTKPVKVNNREFDSWSKFKVGTSTVYTWVNEKAGMKTSSTMTTKLVELGADKVVVETETVTTVMGEEFKVPVLKRDVPKTLEMTTAEAKALESKKPEGTYEEGTETIKVGGTEIKTKWYKFKTKEPNLGDLEGQTWASEDVPGMIVKMITKGDKLSVKMELTEFTKK